MGINPKRMPQAKPAAICVFFTLPFRARNNLAIGFIKTYLLMVMGNFKWKFGNLQVIF